MIRKVLSNSYQRWTLYNLPYMYVLCCMPHIQYAGRILVCYLFVQMRLISYPRWHCASLQLYGSVFGLGLFAWMVRQRIQGCPSTAFTQGNLIHYMIKYMRVYMNSIYIYIYYIHRYCIHVCYTVWMETQWFIAILSIFHYIKYTYILLFL